jgi:hypothetical protein
MPVGADKVALSVRPVAVAVPTLSTPNDIEVDEPTLNLESDDSWNVNTGELALTARALVAMATDRMERKAQAKRWHVVIEILLTQRLAYAYNKIRVLSN